MKTPENCRNQKYAVDVFAGVNLGKSKEHRWTKIGSGTRNADGTIDLRFDFWPGNDHLIQVRPVAATKKTSVGNGL